MGHSMLEDFSLADSKQNHEFITARLWGIADTAPYMHDGRAFTLVEAITMHGGHGSEAQGAAQNFADLTDEDKNKVLSFLMSLRTPNQQAKHLQSKTDK